MKARGRVFQRCLPALIVLGLAAALLTGPSPASAASSTWSLTACAKGNYKAFASIVTVGGVGVSLRGTAVAVPGSGICQTVVYKPQPIQAMTAKWGIDAWGIYLNGSKNFLVGNNHYPSRVITPADGDVKITFTGTTSDAALGATATVTQGSMSWSLKNTTPQH